MPIEVKWLERAPYPMETCKICGARTPCFMRGQVHSTIRKLLRLPYCAIICENCKEITGWEDPREYKYDVKLTTGEK